MTPLHELDRYEELVMTLGQRASRGVRLIAYTPEFAQFVLPCGSALVVLRHLRGDGERLGRMVLRVCAGLKQGKLYLVAAGGDSGAHAILTAHRPRGIFGGKVFVFAIGDTREIWAGHRSTPTRDLSAAFSAMARPLERTPAQFHSWMTAQREAARALRSRVEAYRQSMAERKPRATSALILVLLAVYGLEWVFGGADSVPTLVRMGAMVGEGPGRSEPWRLLSHSFLHASTMHIAGNAMILWILGSFLERLIGASRLITLWTLSVLGGGLASLATPGSAAVMVGASGGGWGLMAAAGLLALRPGGLIPDDFARSLRRNIGQVLIINLFISLLPGIALAAHLGGGAAGALVILSGLGTLGLNPSHLPSARGGGSEMAAAAHGLGLACAAGLMLSLGTGLMLGEAWLLTAPPTWERHEIGPPRLSIELPSSLPTGARKESPEGSLLVYGDPLSDPLRLQISISPIRGPMGTPTQSPIRLYREYRALRKRHMEEPLREGMTRLGEPIEQEQPESFHLDEVFSLPGGGRLWRHSRVVPSAAVVVTIIADERDGSKKAPWAARIVGSLETGYERAGDPPD
jgi:rhomboid protease GluP